MLSLSASNLLVFFSSEQKAGGFWYREYEGCYECSTDLQDMFQGSPGRCWSSPLPLGAGVIYLGSLLNVLSNVFHEYLWQVFID